jgi:uncharacterized protein with HEPN domain
MRDDRTCLLEILEAIRRIRKYTEDGRSSFFSNSMAQDAVVRNIEIMGEATRAIAQPFKDAHPEIPWRKIIGMRNILIHEYFRVDLEAVWSVVEKDLAVLDSAIARTLEQTGD